MIVIDTNVLAYRFVDATDSPRRSLAERLLERERVLLPTLWRHEFLNVLVNCARIRQIDASQASRSWTDAIATAQDIEAPVDMARALDLALELRISAYDAQFLALAEAANTFLITEDKRLRLAAGKRARSMAEHLAA